MDKTVQIVVGDKWTIPLPEPYSNRSPIVSITETFSIPDGVSIEEVNKLYFGRVKELRTIVNEQLTTCRKEILNKSNDEALKSFRFYNDKGQVDDYDSIDFKYVSVTTVLNPEPKSEEEKNRLKPYGEKGDFYHEQLSKALSEGDTSSIPNDMLWIFDNKDFDFRRSEFFVIDEDNAVAGTCDADGFYQKKLAGYDLKTGNLNYKDALTKAKEQVAEYWNADGKRWDLGIILPTHEKMKKEPIIINRNELETHLQSFLKKRMIFKERYGI